MAKTYQIIIHPCHIIQCQFPCGLFSFPAHSYHNWWAYRYYICEVLALINVVGQMFLMDRFFEGEFIRFGLNVILYMNTDEENRIDPLTYIFPRMTKCTFFKYGVSGEVERHDAVCILPLNVVNEKIYIFLWFWFILLTVLTVFTLVYRVLVIFSPRMRVYLLRIRFRLVKRESVETIVRQSKMGDWFLLYVLGENIDMFIYRDVIHELAAKLQATNSSHHHHHQHHSPSAPPPHRTSNKTPLMASSTNTTTTTTTGVGATSDFDEKRVSTSNGKKLGFVEEV